MRLRIAVPITLAALAIAGCSGHAATGHAPASPSGAPPSTSATASATASSIAGVQQVTIHATNGLRFTPSTIHVHPGTVEITLVDDGSYPHNISLPGQNLTSKPVTGGLGEQSTTMRLSLMTPGTYTFVCTYHSQAGMRGEIIVD